MDLNITTTEVFWSLSAMTLPVLFGFLAFQSEGTCSTGDPINMRGYIGAAKLMAMVVLNVYPVGLVTPSPPVCRPFPSFCRFSPYKLFATLPSW